MSGTAPQRRRTRRPRAEREAEILEAARGAFAERGYGATSVGEIAARAGVVEGTVYSYFESKRALLIAVMRRFYEELIESTESGLAAVHGSENRLRFVLRRHLETFTADLGLCRVIIREARPDLALYDEAILALNRRYTGVALRVLEEGVEDGTFRTDLAPSVIRDLLYGGIEHAVWRFVFGDGELDPSGLADQLASALLCGIRATPSRETDATVIRLERAVARLESHIDAGETPAVAERDG
jgi:TetR/AcrR family fatty acid metabolism transcriptional regulator